MKATSLRLIKFLFITTVTLCTATLPSHSQITGGVKGGFNFLYSDWETPGLSRSYSGVSYHVGVFGELSLPQQLFLQTEIQFNSFRIDYAGEYYTAHYLSLPVVCGYSLLNDLVSIHAGPQISYLLSADPQSLDSAIDNWEFAITIGSGITIKRFQLTARYIIGITNLASDDIKAFFPEATIKNSNFQLSLGYRLFGNSRAR